MTPAARRIPRNVLDAARAALAASGRDLESLSSQAGIAPVALEGDLAYEQMDRFYALAFEAMGNPAFGLQAARRLRPERFGIMGIVAMAGPTLGTALRRLSRYNQLHWGNSCELLRQRDRSSYQVLSSGPERSYSRACIDTELAVPLTFARQFTGRLITPLEVRVRQPAPSYAALYSEVFGCPIQFGSTEDSVVFCTADLELPLLSSHQPEFADAAEQTAESMLHRMQSHSVVAQVCQVLQGRMHGAEQGLPAVASALHMSPRSLQRKLAAEGVSFSQLLDTVRRAAAERYLAATRLGLAEIAFRLGFEEPNSFFRAFKRWTGTSPEEWRRHPSV